MKTEIVIYVQMSAHLTHSALKMISMSVFVMVIHVIPVLVIIKLGRQKSKKAMDMVAFYKMKIIQLKKLLLIMNLLNKYY